MPEEPSRRLLVDGMNVIGARPDGWWRDRDAAVRRLVAALQRMAEAEQREITVVLDGRPLDDLPAGEHGGIAVRYAERPGSNAADDVIVALALGDAEPETLEVVTSDRGLRERLAGAPVGVTGAGTFREQLERLHDSGRDGGSP